MRKLSIYYIDDKWMVYVCVPPREVNWNSSLFRNHFKDHEYIFDTFEEVIVFMRLGGGGEVLAKIRKENKTNEKN